jgi:hypothetical protein
VAREQLRKLLAEVFTQDMQAREEQSREIETRLAKLRKQYKEREAAKDQIIDLQLKVIEQDAAGLGFPTGESKGTPATSNRDSADSIGTRRQVGGANPHNHQPVKDNGAYFPGSPGTPAVWKEKLAETERANPTAWGNEVDGLQVGLGYYPGQKRAYRHGETVRLVVRLRNVGQNRVQFPFVPTHLAEALPTLTDSEGNAVPLGQPPTQERRHARQSIILSPGSEVELTEITLVLKPVSEKNAAPDERQTIERARKRSLTLYGSGRFHIQYGTTDGESALAGVFNFDPNLSKLVTGKLELDVQSDSHADDKTQSDVRDNKVIAPADESVAFTERHRRNSVAQLQGAWICVSAGNNERQLGEEELGSLDLQLTIFGRRSHDQLQRQ